MAIRPRGAAVGNRGASADGPTASSLDRPSRDPSDPRCQALDHWGACSCGPPAGGIQDTSSNCAVPPLVSTCRAFFGGGFPSPRERDVGEHVADVDVGPMRGERHHGAIEGAAHRMVGHESQEDHRLVEGVGCTPRNRAVTGRPVRCARRRRRARPPPPVDRPPATSPRRVLRPTHFWRRTCPLCWFLSPWPSWWPSWSCLGLALSPLLDFAALALWVLATFSVLPALAALVAVAGSVPLLPWLPWPSCPPSLPWWPSVRRLLAAFAVSPPWLPNLRRVRCLGGVRGWPPLTALAAFAGLDPRAPPPPRS